MTGDRRQSIVKTGCCGFRTSRRDYFSRFKLVEVQQTFYKMPRLKTALRWRQQAPVDFEFTLKASQLITHLSTSPTYRKAGIRITEGTEDNYGFFRPTDEVHQAWQEIREFARALETRVILFQCPPGFKETTENVDNIKRFRLALVVTTTNEGGRGGKTKYFGNNSRLRRRELFFELC